MIYVSIDLETTGLNPQAHDIVEFGAVIDNLANPQPIESLPRLHIMFQKENYSGNAYCMALHKRIWDALVKVEQNKDGKPWPAGENVRVMEIEDLMPAFSNFLSKNGVPYNEKKQRYDVNVAGKNFASFDWQFLKAKIPADKWYDVYFRHRVLDPSVLYFDPKVDTELPGMELCLERAGIKEEVTHGAVDDALQVVKLIRHKFNN